MKKFIILYFALIYMAMLLAGCISTKQHARNLVNRGTKLIQRGIKLDQSVSDSVKSVKDITVFVPGDSGTMAVKPEIDTVSFDRTMEEYDGNLLLIDSLNQMLKDGTLVLKTGQLIQPDIERIMAEQKKAIEAMKKDRQRLMKGFAKDSVYHFEDSTLVLDVTIKGGALQKIHHVIKDRTVKAKVETTSINLDGSVVTAMWRQSWFWIMLLLILVLLLLNIVQLLKR